MTMRIESDDDAPVPRATRLLLSCDGHDHGLFEDYRLFPQVFLDAGGYVEQRAAATRAGWRETFDPKLGRVFLCPLCSKRSA